MLNTCILTHIYIHVYFDTYIYIYIYIYYIYILNTCILLHTGGKREVILDSRYI